MQARVSEQFPGLVLNNKARRLTVAPPRIVTADGKVFDREQGVVMRYMQNCAVQPVYYAVGKEANASSFHEVLSACSAQDDGTGGVIDLSSFEGEVWIKAQSGTPRVSTFVAYGPEHNLGA